MRQPLSAVAERINRRRRAECAQQEQPVDQSILPAFVLGQPDVTRVRAQTLPDNEASMRALRSAGFEEDDPGSKVKRFVKEVRTAG